MKKGVMYPKTKDQRITLTLTVIFPPPQMRVVLWYLHLRLQRSVSDMR